MTPVKLALWISKFVVSLALLLVVIPTGVFYGGAYAVSAYQEHQATKARRASECAEDKLELRYVSEMKVKTFTDVTLPKGYEDATMQPMENGHITKGIGGNLQHPLWFFEDGSSVPLDDFIATTQKDIALVCDK